MRNMICHLLNFALRILD